MCGSYSSWEDTRHKCSGTFPQKPDTDGKTVSYKAQRTFTVLGPSTVSDILASALHDRKAASTSTQVAITHQPTHTSTVANLPSQNTRSRSECAQQKSIKAIFKVPQATSNKPKSHITVPIIPRYGNIQLCVETARSRRKLQRYLYCSVRARTQTYHSRARGYKKSVSSSSLIYIDGGSGGAGLELAEMSGPRQRSGGGRTGTGGGRANPGSTGATVRTGGLMQWCGGGGTGAGGDCSRGRPASRSIASSRTW